NAKTVLLTGHLHVVATAIVAPFSPCNQPLKLGVIEPTAGGAVCSRFTRRTATIGSVGTTGAILHTAVAQARQRTFRGTKLRRIRARVLATSELSAECGGEESTWVRPWTRLRTRHAPSQTVATLGSNPHAANAQLSPSARDRVTMPP